MNNVFFYCHRINNSNELDNVLNKNGIEIDIRDKDDNLILVHDPFSNGENFEK